MWETFLEKNLTTKSANILRIVIRKAYASHKKPLKQTKFIKAKFGTSFDYLLCNSIA